MQTKVRSKKANLARGVVREGAVAATVVAAILVTGTPLAQTVPAPSPAIAQAPGGQPLPTRQEEDYRTPSQRAAENYDAQGVRAGSFLIFPELELGEEFNDNIYAAATGKTSSFIQLVKPSIEAKSQWSNHMLNFFARGALGFYSADGNQNFQDVSAGADGRLDIMR